MLGPLCNCFLTRNFKGAGAKMKAALFMHTNTEWIGFWVNGWENISLVGFDWELTSQELSDTWEGTEEESWPHQTWFGPRPYISLAICAVEYETSSLTMSIHFVKAFSRSWGETDEVGQWPVRRLIYGTAEAVQLPTTVSVCWFLLQRYSSPTPALLHASICCSAFLAWALPVPPVIITPSSTTIPPIIFPPSFITAQQSTLSRLLSCHLTSVRSVKTKKKPATHPLPLTVA